MRRVLLGLVLWLAASCAHAQTAPSPADVGIVKGTTDTYKLKDSGNSWVPFGTSTGHVFTPVGGGGSINTPPAGSTPVNGACPSGQFLYNNSGNVGCAAVSGAGAAPFTLYATHALLLAGVTTPTGSSTVGQQGFYASGDGGAATYNWNATTYCEGGSSTSPAPADQITCILPAGQSPSTAGRYIFQTTNSIDARQVGMQPGGQDNSPYAEALMTAASNSYGLAAAREITFSANVPQPVSSYYFSQPFVASRNALISCGGTGRNTLGPVVLVFPPGVDGVSQDQPYLTPDSGYGQSDINGCSFYALGQGFGLGAYTTYPTATIIAGGSGYTGTTGTLTHDGSGGEGSCSVQPAYTVTAAAGVITAITGATNAGHCTGGIPDGSLAWIASGGLSGGSGVSLGLSDGQVVLPNAGGVVVSNGLSNTLGPNDPNFPMPSSCNPINNTCTVAVGDGIVGNANWLGVGTQLATSPGAYVTAVNNAVSPKTFTLNTPILGAGFRSGSWAAGGGMNYYDLPAAQKFTVNTVSGSNSVTVTTGPQEFNSGTRTLKPGDVIWNDAFLFGTSVQRLISNSIVGAVTVHSGGSGFVGTSGTMEWTGYGCSYLGTHPVLNVTASAGVITGVTSVANAGNCLASTPGSSATTWTPGGGLSGGSGASFNMTFNQVVTMGSITEQEEAPTLASVTETGGKLWTLPVGIHRRAQGATHNATVEGFAFGLKLTCGGTTPETGCNGSTDVNGQFTYGLVGRLVIGDNSGVSLAMGNVYSENSIADEVEAGSIGSTYISEEDNSQDNASTLFGTLIFCGTNNYSVFIGSYMSGQDRTSTLGYARGCLGHDAQGNTNIGVDPAEGITSGSFIGPIYGAPLPISGAGGNTGSFGFSGKAAIEYATTATSAAGQNVVTLTLPNTGTVSPSMRITDLTHPVIPANTTVTEVGDTALGISNNITGAGIQIGDKINISGYDVIFKIIPGFENGFSGLAFGDNQNGFQYALSRNGRAGTWDLGPSSGAMMRMAGGAYQGYAFDGGNDMVFPQGLELGNYQTAIGGERNLDSGSAAPTAETINLQGNVRLNSTPLPGGPLAWIDAEAFRTTLSGAVTAGTTTSVAVAACPTVAPPAGLVVIDFTGRTGAVSGINVQQPIGNVATCVGTTLTLQAAALNSVPSGHTIQFLQWGAAGTVQDLSPPRASSCGTSPAIASGSNNLAGQFTMGTGAPTACTVLFGHPYPNHAFCTVSPASSGGAAPTGGHYISIQDNTGFILTLGTGASSLVFNYACGGS